MTQECRGRVDAIAPGAGIGVCTSYAPSPSTRDHILLFLLMLLGTIIEFVMVAEGVGWWL